MIEPSDRIVAAFDQAETEFRRAELERLGLKRMNLRETDEGAFRAGLGAALAAFVKETPKYYRYADTLCPRCGAELEQEGK